MTDAILFDCWGTLVDAPGLVSSGGKDRLFHKYLQDRGINLDFESFCNLFYSTEIQKKGMEENREYSRYETQRQRLIQSLTAMGASYDQELIEGLLDDYAEEWVKRSTLFPSAMDLLQKLRGKYRLGLITNASDKDTTWRVLRNLRLKDLFASIVISGEFGWRKPSPKIFNAALTELAVKPEYAVMVGDSFEADIIGANNLGMKTVYINAENETRSDVPDITIQHIEQLYDRLPEL